MQFTVNDIEAHSPAAYSQIQIGDRLRMVSSAFDGDAASSSPWQVARQQDRVRTITHCDLYQQLLEGAGDCVSVTIGSV